MLTTCITISNHHNYHFRKLSEHQRNHEEKKTSRNLRNNVGGAPECRSSSYFISPHDNWIIDTRASPHQVKVLKSWLSPSCERDFFPPLSALAMINGETERLWKATWRGFRSRKWFSIAEAVWLKYFENWVSVDVSGGIFLRDDIRFVGSAKLDMRIVVWWCDNWSIVFIQKWMLVHVGKRRED